MRNKLNRKGGFKTNPLQIAHILFILAIGGIGVQIFTACGEHSFEEIVSGLLESSDSKASGKNSSSSTKTDNSPSCSELSCTNNCTIFTDARDGKSYKGVKIGTHTWMAENLNYKTPDGASRCYPPSGGSILGNGITDADEGLCSTYGRLYYWATAMNINQSYNSTPFTAPAKHKGICPSGWHIPSKAEWGILATYVQGSAFEYYSGVAGTKLKSKSGWKNHGGKSGNGTDDYCFAALPSGDIAGHCGCPGGGNGYYGNWWSSTDTASEDDDADIIDPRGVYSLMIYNDEEYLLYVIGSKENWLSVRCVKD